MMRLGPNTDFFGASTRRDFSVLDALPLLFERCSIDNAFASPRYGFQSRADALTPASSIPNTGTVS
ncbi:hypothetical protein RZS08_61035, partial [Arthrospira platensis SPKY1]|nr:hypothetical protein [Arthrospira platensis SPKY1]